MPNGWRTINSLVHKIRLHGRRGKGMAESFSRQKSRHAPQKEGGLKILCDPGWYVQLDVQNGWEENTHTHLLLYTHSHHFMQTGQRPGIRIITCSWSAQQGKMCFSLSPFAPKKLVSRGSFCRPVLHQPPLIIHSQAESGVQQSCECGRKGWTRS